jgi:integrase
VLPAFGRRQVNEITVNDVADLVVDLRRRGLKAWTIRGMLTPLSRLFAYALREGLVMSNPVKALDKTERPKGDQRKMQILEREEIQRVLDKAPARFRPALATAVFTGLRQGELLRLRWSDVDLENGYLLVGESKTAAGEGREVMLMPGLVKLLREHRLASWYSKDEDFVFVSEIGTPIDPSHLVNRGLKKALERAKISKSIRWHDLRHTFASIMIGQGSDVAFVSRQLGHSSPVVTLKIYAHLFDRQAKEQEARQALEDAFGGML